MASTMKDYTKPEYKGLYKEILKDQQWTWGKFNLFHIQPGLNPLKMYT